MAQKGNQTTLTIRLSIGIGIGEARTTVQPRGMISDIK